MQCFEQIDDTGYVLIDGMIPRACVRDCSRPGSVDAAIDSWKHILGFSAPKQGTADYLASTGAWDDSELVDHETNLERLLWLVCCDLAEERRK